jgi:predicted DNA-binding protein (MmcQ/YjbR family)
VRQDELRGYCLAKPGARAGEPWGGAVAKPGRKTFAFPGAAGPGGDAGSAGLKCGASREAAREWTLRCPGDAAVMPCTGRSGWNNPTTGAATAGDEILEATDASYAMTVSKLPNKDRPLPS